MKTIKQLDAAISRAERKLQECYHKAGDDEQNWSRKDKQRIEHLQDLLECLERAANSVWLGKEIPADVSRALDALKHTKGGIFPRVTLTVIGVTP